MRALFIKSLFVLLTVMSVSAEPFTIDKPEQLAPSRPVPLVESLPSAEEGRELKVLSLNLEQAMSLALQETPTLAKLQSRIRLTEYQVDEAYTAANPRIDFSSQYSRIEPPVSLPGGGPVINPANNYQLSLVIRQTISTFGRMKWNALASKLSRRSAQEEYRAEINRLISLVAQRYIEALLAQDQVVIAQDDLEARLAALRTSELLLEQGVVARFDFLRNSAAASQAQQVLIEARTGESVAKSRLLSLLDQPLQRQLELRPLEPELPNEEQELAEAKTLALDTRPDLRALRWAVESAKARVKFAKASNNPTLELQNTTVNRNATGFSPGTQNTTALVLSIPLFDGGVSRAQREQAKETVKQLVLDLEQAERDVVLQIEEVHQQLFDRWRAISVAEDNVVQAEEALRVAVLRYENGISTNVELLESQAARSQARFQLAQTKSQFLLSRWNWWQVTAGTYPVEVPLSPEVRSRLEQEGLPKTIELFPNPS